MKKQNSPGRRTKLPIVLAAAAVCLCILLIGVRLIPLRLGPFLKIDRPDEIAAIQVTQSSGVYSPFVVYDTQDPQEIADFCDALRGAKVHINALHTKKHPIQYTGKLYDAVIWTHTDSRTDFVFTSDGKLYARGLQFSFEEESCVQALAALLSGWTAEESG